MNLQEKIIALESELAAEKEIERLTWGECSRLNELQKLATDAWVPHHRSIDAIQKQLTALRELAAGR